MPEEKKSAAQNEPEVLFGDEAKGVSDHHLHQLVDSVINPDISDPRLRDVVEMQHQKIITARDEQRLAVANVLGQPVSATQLKYWGTWRGRPMFELKGVITDPHFRRQGLAAKVQQRCIEAVLEKDPHSLVIVITATPDLKSHYDRLVEQGSWRLMSVKECQETALKNPQEKIFSPDFIKNGDSTVRIYAYDHQSVRQ